MNLPFTVEQFIDVFVRYNQAIWPMQLIAYALGLAAVFLAFRKNGHSGITVSLILSFFWLWMGVVYHWMYFSGINKAAFLFGALFVLQGVFFLVAGAVQKKLSFGFKPGFYAVTGIFFIVYAMLVYPVLGYLSGHGYPRSPCFGVAPCPVTIFTFGLLLLTDKRVPKYILVVPFLWSLLGFSAALALTIREDIGLLTAGVLGTILIIVRDRKSHVAH
jgi:hypothetical protein